MKNFWLPVFCYLLYLHASATGYDIKTSSIIDQPAIEVLGDYNGSWYVIGFEKPNHPEKPARFYILKYAAGFPTAKCSPVYPPFGEKTDYLKAAIVNNKVSIFYSRTEHLPERPNMVDSRDGYKQIPKIMRQDYDPVTLLPAGEPVVVFDETKEHFASCGIDIAHSEDRTKTAILIKHYFRQNKFKVLLIDNANGKSIERTYPIKIEKDLINFRRLLVNNDGQIFIEARKQEDPLHPDTKAKKGAQFYFFSIDINSDEPAMLNLAPAIGGNQTTKQPIIACLNNSELLISYDHYSNAGIPILKGISVTKYKPDFTISGTQDIVPETKFINQAATYQTGKTGLEYLETRQILPLLGGNFMVIAEYQRSTDTKDKVTGVVSTLIERHYLLTYRIDETMSIKAASFIDKKQSAHNIGYAFSARAFRLGNDAYVFHNDDCEADGEHGLSLLATQFPANGGEPVTKKIVRTSEDFFISMERLYPAGDKRILFTEEKLVDFTSEARELKLLEVTLK